MTRFERICRVLDRDDVFEPLQIVLVPAVLWLACMCFG